MENTKKFNPFRYVYGRLYAAQFIGKDGIGFVFEESQKVYSWQGILYWFKKEGYIFDYQIGNVNYDTSVIAFKFNRQRITFEYYIKGVERSLKKNSLAIEPMGDLIERKAYDEFESQYNKPVEYIEAADRCLSELNKMLMKELIEATSKSSNNDEEQKAA
ncbi:hypothetical protein IJ750_02620 [bacterium]|nr:hypothetical protein [bacterium]